jgi:hypothetical protein
VLPNPNLDFDPNPNPTRSSTLTLTLKAHAHVLRACALLKASPLVKNKLLHSYSTRVEPLVGCFAESFEEWRAAPSRDAGVALDEDLLRWFKDRGTAKHWDLHPPPIPSPPPPPPLSPRPPSAPPGQTCCGENNCADPPYECLTWDEYYKRRNDYYRRYSYSDDDSRYLHEYKPDVGFVQPITSDGASSSSDDS